tara:strand:+ start:11688 stop:13100 length:1413 start_codon:yes stop_codon:yes gene_type:complete
MSALHWFRKDLRIKDNISLMNALNKNCRNAVFVFDTHILNKLNYNTDRRVQFIAESLKELSENLLMVNVQLHVLHGKPEIVIPELCNSLSIDSLFYNRDYEPYAVKRDSQINDLCKILNIKVYNFKDAVIFEKDEILKQDNTPYHVFTAYKNKWLDTFKTTILSFNKNKSIITHKKSNFINKTTFNIEFWMKKIGFNSTENEFLGGESKGYQLLDEFSKKINFYHESRDFVQLKGTSNLSVYLRFGCVSIRDCVTLGLNTEGKGAQVWLSELIWREFYSMILSTYPHTESQAFKSVYDKINWHQDDYLFNAWVQGKTGFPIIDASMRCLNQTGRLHNRLRMVVASFFCKTLCLDWRLGERYFASKLLDFDLASNVGGWQWSASTGCDSAPYFRIFNPWLQSKKFDNAAGFMKKWLPELQSIESKSFHDLSLLKDSLVRSFGINHNMYMNPVVNYKNQRDEALKMYSIIKQ